MKKTQLFRRIIKKIHAIPIELKAGLISLLSLFGVFFILNFLFPLDFSIEYSTIVTAKDSTVIHAFLTTDDKWRMKTELDEITPQLEKAIIHKEDKYFYYHFGVNPLAIVRALINNTLSRKRTSGASTITMQVARLLKPKERSYWNKLREMFRAMQLEYRFSKKEILQMYFNLVPYGGNIEGVKAASILYFDKASNHLSLAEITALSIIPNRPNSLRIGENNSYIEKERNRWLLRFKEAEVFDNQTIEDAISEPLDAYRHEAPKTAPHFSYRIKRRYPNLPIIKTNLQLAVQKKTEKIVSNYIQRLYWHNIKNAAVLIVDNQTNEVVAYVGSADFYNTEDAGQVDGITAVRSPGSTLKPLLYAVSFDKGIITPKFMVSDVPVNFSGYEPENYDGKFNGLVTIEYALANSLNVPAVKVLNELGTGTFIKALKDAGFQKIKEDEEKLGLSVVLGGCGATLEELTKLYCCFANYGTFRHIKWLRANDLPLWRPDSFHLISPSAAFMVTEILTKLTRPDLPYQWQNSSHLPKVAWKTGTSYGRRDAWSIGYNKNYTIGVWVGNFSAESVPELSGANSAAPLLFHIFNAIDYDSPAEWYSAPDSLDFRLVCSQSGLPPNDFCDNQIMDYYIPGVSANRKCRHLKRVWISADSSISYCTTCLPEAGYIKALYPDYPPEIVTYFENNQIQYKKIPPHNPKCERLFVDGAPQITSPVKNLEYFVDIADSTEVMLTCNVSSDVEKVFWYINNRFYQSISPTEKLFFVPPKGKVKISCTDDKGRNSDIWIHVKYVRF